MSSVSREATLAGVGTLHLSIERTELNEDDSYTIHGIALGAGDVTVGQSGIKKLWPGEELKRSAETLQGKDLVRDHINTTEGKIGEVTHTEYLEDVGVIYEAEVAPHYDQLAQDIEAGLMEVSVRAYHAPEDHLEQDEETGALRIKDILFDNLSVVNDGASPSNTAETGEIDDFKDEYGGVEASVTVPDAGPTAVLSRSSAVLEADQQLADRDTDVAGLSMDTGDDPTVGKVFAPEEDSLFESKEDAEAKGDELGCGREAHEVEHNGETFYAPCANEAEFKKHAIESVDEAEAMSLIEDGMMFFSTVNDSMVEVVSIDGDIATVEGDDGDSRWKEQVDNIIRKIADDEWKHASGEEESDGDTERTHFAALDPRDSIEADECTDCLSEETIAELVDIPGTYSANGTVFAIAPDEHNDDSTEHPDNAKYPMTSCTGDDSVESAWKLRGNGNYSIEQSTLEKRIIEAAKSMDCDPGVVGMDEFNSGETDNSSESDTVEAESGSDDVDADSDDDLADGGCPDGYEQVGMKETDDGEMVPNCAPVEHNSEQSRTVSVAQTELLSTSDGRSGEVTSIQTQNMIETIDVNLDELSEDDIEGKVIVEEQELESLADKAERAESVEGELSELSEKLDEQDEASEVIDELADEEVDLIDSDTEHAVVEAGKADLVDDVTEIYAEELAEYYPGMSAESLGEKFSPLQLRDMHEEHGEAELSSSIEDTEPEPEAGTASEDELADQTEGDSEELSEEEKREEYAEYLANAGWERQAEKVRNGELEISETAE